MQFIDSTRRKIVSTFWNSTIIMIWYLLAIYPVLDNIYVSLNNILFYFILGITRLSIQCLYSEYECEDNIHFGTFPHLFSIFRNKEADSVSLQFVF